MNSIVSRKQRNGKWYNCMEYLDIVDEAGQPTGEIISRDEAHQQGILHRTAHVWVVRRLDYYFTTINS